MTSVELGKLFWLIGLIGLMVVRYRPLRIARKVPTAARPSYLRELIHNGFVVAAVAAVPAVYAIANEPRFANYAIGPVQIALGVIVGAVSVWLMRRTHKDLGTNWSAVLELREQHMLVTTGIYSQLRHPMYSAIGLWTCAQALLLGNWVAGLIGLVVYATYLVPRIGREEELLIGRFGDEYRRYMERTSRVIPGVY